MVFGVNFAVTSGARHFQRICSFTLCRQRHWTVCSGQWHCETGRCYSALASDSIGDAAAAAAAAGADGGGGGDTVEHTDIVVCGGGIVGLTAALALATSPLLSACRVTVLEKGAAPLAWQKPASHGAAATAKYSADDEFRSRTCALNASSRALLGRLGVWRRLARYGTVDTMQVWDGQSDAMIRFSASTDGSGAAAEASVDPVASAAGDAPGALAWIVENEALVDALAERLAEEVQASAGRCRMVYGCSQLAVSLEDGEVSAFVGGGGDTSTPDADHNAGDAERRGRCRWRCQLIVGADGVSSTVRRAMGVATVGWPYHQRAVVATLCVGDQSSMPSTLAAAGDGGARFDDTAAMANANRTAWQRFLPDGPLALLPLSATRSALVWSTSVERAELLTTLDDAAFVDAVNTALWQSPPATTTTCSSSGSGGSSHDGWLRCWQWSSERLAALLVTAGHRSPSGPRQLPPAIGAVASGSRASFPLALQHAVRYIKCPSAAGGAAGGATGAAAVLVGDAAHRLHPLAGQGANLGVADVCELVEQLGASVARHGRLLTAPQPLLAYERRRMPSACAMLALTNTLHTLYTSNWRPLVVARSVGLQVCDAVAPVRRLLARHARA